MWNAMFKPELRARKQQRIIHGAAPAGLEASL